MRRPAETIVAFLLLCGFVAGAFVVRARLPAARSGELVATDSELQLPLPHKPELLVRPERWQPFPALRRDFDLDAVVELAPGASFDLVLRRLEPREVRGVALPFHGRFAVLRMSTTADGPGWRTPADALLAAPGGVRLAPGVPASVHVEARGRELRANVAGKVLPPVLAQDEIGSLALIARDAPVAVQRLVVQPVGARWEPSAWAIGMAAGLVAGAFAVRLRAGWKRAALAGGALLAGVYAAGANGFAAMPPLALPEARDDLLTVLAGLPLALAVCLRGRALWAGLLVGLLACGGLSWVVRQRTAERFPPTKALDELFGPASGTQVAEALAHCVHGPSGLHLADAAKSFVFLLGGELLWQRPGRAGSALQEVELLLGTDLRRDHPTVEVASLPTVDGWSAQQWRLFATCYTSFAPKVIVFGVPRDEDAVDERTGARRSSPASLEQTVAQAEQYAAQHGARLLLVADCGLDANLYAVLSRARDRGLPLVEIRVDEPADAIAKALGEQVRKLLP
jgi:hypothetical protein